MNLRKTVGVILRRLGLPVGKISLEEAIAAVSRFPSRRGRRPHELGTSLIVNLTSYPPRFPTLALTLKSLLDQTITADRTVLWIAEGDFDQLPADVVALTAFGLDIRTCRDIRSYKKLIPALEAFPASVLVTADDDCYYPPDWLASLVAVSQKAPTAVVAGRARSIAFLNDGRAAPYLEWPLIDGARRHSAHEIAFPTGVGGVLYPPGSLSPYVADEARFLALCPSADDVWFFWMARLADAPHRVTDRQFQIITWPSSQVDALQTINLEGRNDDQIRAMETEYGLVSR